MLAHTLEALVRSEGGRILAGLIRHCGDFDRAEEARQDAYLQALRTWPQSGLPAKPAAWITTVAQRALIDVHRKDVPLVHDASVLETLADSAISAEAALIERSVVEDDLLRLIFTCCHPALAPAAQSALALKTVCQLSVAEIARAYVEPESTTAQRLTRAKRKIAEAKIAYEVPLSRDLPERLVVVLDVIYLMFNEGYLAAQADHLMRTDLCVEALRLGRMLDELLPQEAEVKGLLALMQFNHARRGARLNAKGELVPLEEQDRTRWDHALIAEATITLDSAVAINRPGRLQVEAAIAALHTAVNTSASGAQTTDWAQIALLYRSLMGYRNDAVVQLNAAVALAMSRPDAITTALQLIDGIEQQGTLTQYHLLPAAKADLYRRQGDLVNAARFYEEALAHVSNAAERQYLERRLASIRYR
jgi:RNA polymerase sigma-70 factor, ECF subfamily